MDTSDLAFPKPGDIEREPETVHVQDDGRECCNMLTAAGRTEYRNRTIQMLRRQRFRCCLEGHAPMCPGRLIPREATFEHENGRGSGGGKRDDRITLPDGRWINGAAHAICNGWKGSRHIDFNRRLQAQ